MRHIKLLVCSILFIGLGLTELQAQKSVNATGGNASGSGGSVSYSVGQVVFTTYTATYGSIIQGVQQPFEISVITSLEEAKDINLAVDAYPNPVSENLTLKIDYIKFSSLNYQLFDANGKLLKKEQITGAETKIAMSNLIQSIYFVKVYNGNKEIKSFKIIKSH